MECTLAGMSGAVHERHNSRVHQFRNDIQNMFHIEIARPCDCGKGPFKACLYVFESQRNKDEEREAKAKG